MYATIERFRKIIEDRTLMDRVVISIYLNILKCCDLIDSLVAIDMFIKIEI